MVSDQGILFIEPNTDASRVPIVDVLTRRMTAALRRAKKGKAVNGNHICICGVVSDNCDYTLPNGELTHLLAVHYLAIHRESIPPIELEKVRALNCGEDEPTELEIYGK